MSDQEIAEAIADDLFTNGEGEKADRLVLIENIGAGWTKNLGSVGRLTVASRILTILSAAKDDKPNE